MSLESTPLARLTRQRVQLLYQRAGLQPNQSHLLLTEAFEELQAALDWLQVAEEEISHHQAALAELQSASDPEHQYYRDLFVDAPEAYLVISSNGTIRRANQLARCLLNADEKFLTGRPLAFFVAEGGRRIFRDTLLAAVAQGRVRNWAVRMQPYDGAAFDALLTTATVYNQSKKPQALRMIMRDL